MKYIIALLLSLVLIGSCTGSASLSYRQSYDSDYYHSLAEHWAFGRGLVFLSAYCDDLGGCSVHVQRRYNRRPLYIRSWWVQLDCGQLSCRVDPRY